MDDAAINVLIAREIISKNSPNVKIVSSRFMYPSLKNNDANSSIHQIVYLFALEKTFADQVEHALLPRTNHFSNVFVERNDWPADRRTTSIRRVQCCRFGDKRALGVEWSSIYLHRGYQQLAATLTPCLRSLLPFLPSLLLH